ncbi:PRC-barrel domain-containing protein [Arenibaculum sp.]|jgi:hypothetical protein|uniref:PRC-barrel domain-containing protein n=1 Tax=Arenibaculum sp. TaxID=2865862 RepID=UPI002E126594|nr:PRC-barrel domain-containing protein [Arenibaculum sp.]
MIRSLDVLRSYTIRATDDVLGGVRDLYFDDTSWTVRYLVVDTGTWLPGRSVLIPTSALGKPDAARQHFPVDLTRRQVKDSPDVDVDRPVSRQVEADVYGYYGWAPYWGAGAGVAPGMPGYMAVPPPQTAPPVRHREEGDPHLRSGREVTGYYIGASDGDVGHVDDLLVEDDGWRLRYLLVDTVNWLPGRKVLVASDWIRSVSWSEQKIHVGLTREQVKNSPEYDEVAGVNRAYEEQLYAHYGERPYWGV